MQLIMLGTGNATVKKCYNTCFMIEEEKQYFLVDAGGGNGIFNQLDQAGVKFENIHHIFVTHEHIDHLLGVIWLIRMIGQKINQGKYEGNLYIYCFEELAEKIETITRLTVQKKVCDNFSKRIFFIIVKDGETKEILNNKVTFFDIHSTKAKQFGFTLVNKNGVKLTCAGDEPYNEQNEEYVKNSHWLLHEAFCLYEDAEIFKPYEKHHSTVKEACELAENMKIPNLVLYHTEEKRLKERKIQYTKEGKQYYNGNLYVPDDLECIEVN